MQLYNLHSNKDISRHMQVMLLSDGSVTRHLQLLTDLPVQVVGGLQLSDGL